MKGNVFPWSQGRLVDPVRLIIKLLLHHSSHRVRSWLDIHIILNDSCFYRLQDCTNSIQAHQQSINLDGLIPSGSFRWGFWSLLCLVQSLLHPHSQKIWTSFQEILGWSDKTQGTMTCLWWWSRWHTWKAFTCVILQNVSIHTFYKTWIPRKWDIP